MDKDRSSTTIMQLAQHQKRRLAMINSFFIALLLASPVIVYLTTPFRDSPFDWNLDTIQNSLQEGYFWLFPGDALTQLSMRLTSGEDHPIAVVIIILILVLIAAICFGLIVYITMAIIGKGRGKFATDSTIVPVRFLPIAHELVASKVTYDTRDYAVARYGDSIVIQTAIEKNLPEVFIDSRAYSLDRTIGQRVALSKEQEVVLDGTSFEHAVIYSGIGQTKNAYFFDAALVSVIVKQLSFADISVSAGMLTVFIPADKLLSTTSDIRAVIASVTTLIDQMQRSAKREDIRGGTLKKATPMPLIVLPHMPQITKTLYYALWALPVLFYTIVMYVFHDSVSIGMPMFVAWLVVCAFLLSSWSKRRTAAGKVRS